MANKDFLLKVVVPTEDGLTVSAVFDDAPFYLCFNLSELSYQLAEKIRQHEWTQIKMDELHVDAAIKVAGKAALKPEQLLRIEVDSEIAIEQALHRIIDNMPTVTYFQKQQPTGIIELEK
jgi:hypothetical protein